MSATLPARSLRQAMAWIHGWLGLVAGWILFAMFLTGTASYFRPEITRWMQPELGANRTAAADAAAAAVAGLERQGHGGDLQWFIYLPDARTAITRVFAIPQPTATATAGAAKTRSPELELDPATGAPIAARETRGGEHFYRFHFQLQLPHPWGRWLAGLCAMFMLAAIISGVVTHKRIFADFFTLRWNKGQRSWLDAHNVSAVLALPFHAVITYTGLMTLVVMYMPWPIAANYAKPIDFSYDVYGAAPEQEAAGRPVPLVPIAPLMRDAERRLGGEASRVVIRNPGDAAATVTVARTGARAINARAPTVTYAGATGRVIAASPAGGVATSTIGVMLGLHMAQFAGPALRWLLFLLGATGAAMVGTGLLLWTAARRRPNAAPFFGLRLVERLNIATIAGLPVGMAAYLLANRAIPAGWEGRADMEVSAMFWTWGVVAVAQLLLPAARAWRAAFALGALAFAAIPLADLATNPRGIAARCSSRSTRRASPSPRCWGFAAWRAGVPRKAPAGRARMAHARWYMPEALLPAAVALLLFAAASHRFRRESGVVTPFQVRATRIAAILSLLISWWTCGEGLPGERVVRFVIAVSVAAVPIVLALSIAATTILAPIRVLSSRRTR
ncbi:PepSY-associated TM helix domain-containing protein [Sphingomonas adhaesiva]|uniref:PepSY-associated TM helix domain-containing protein n=1 Tax=Sphingomonas adhaesiva TaxID=28212 RepID=UPI002FFC4BF1